MVKLCQQPLKSYMILDIKNKIVYNLTWICIGAASTGLQVDAALLIDWLLLSDDTFSFPAFSDTDSVIGFRGFWVLWLVAVMAGTGWLTSLAVEFFLEARAMALTLSFSLALDLCDNVQAAFINVFIIFILISLSHFL